MNEGELAQCRALLGVDAQVTAEALKKVYVQKSYALIRQGASEAEREQLRAAHATLVAFLDAQEQMAQLERRAEAKVARQEAQVEALVTEERPPERPANPYDPFSFDSWGVNLIAAPVVVAIAIA